MSNDSWVRSLSSGFAALATQPLRGDVLATNPTITSMSVCQRRLAVEIVKRQVRIGSYNLWNCVGARRATYN